MRNNFESHINFLITYKKIPKFAFLFCSIMKGQQQAYQTMSKFGRINLERTRDTHPVGNVDDIIAEIKSMNDKPVKKMSVASTIAVSQRLLSGPHRSTKTRSRYLPRKKPKRKIPVVREYVKPEGADPELPGSAQYNPNFDVYLPSAPQVIFTQAEPEKKMDSSSCTQSEMMQAWQKDLRSIDLIPENPKLLINEPPAAQSTFLKPENNKTPGIISIKAERDSFLGKPNENPPPGTYHIQRQSIDKPRVISFEGQSTRKPIQTLPDRTHFDLAKGIDATKPRPKCAIPFNRQVSREKSDEKKDDIWSEIEAEQKALLDILHPPEQQAKKEKKVIQPFSKQTTYFDKHPFNAFMGPPETKDLEYNVDKSLTALDKKLEPLDNFGRRLKDSDRTIYAKSEAPDVYYPGVPDQWAKTHKSVGSGPIFDNMHDRKSAYDYMPKIGGGSYTFVENDNWSYRTPVVMDKMGERNIIIEIPPQYTRKPVSQSALAYFRPSCD
ncbi:hypothetical protein TRFO_13503 [Tritrichomonas foetus]|uniref:Uncharacterized protein n=1 Tax=Tritrichomonas foetus TaxID=1144522 RepID=A0A1J4KXP0_9EUKA|nr:hypothetical protein TRFO_13503 [Tritrichomonas foetus]|eukprot:OHT16019.1 hypothetical protein TRFO_13503 [Tritrichomonas foetus]